jgi:hypothetical protein
VSVSPEEVQTVQDTNASHLVGSQGLGASTQVPGEVGGFASASSDVPSLAGTSSAIFPTAESTQPAGPPIRFSDPSFRLEPAFFSESLRPLEPGEDLEFLATENLFGAWNAYNATNRLAHGPDVYFVPPSEIRALMKVHRRGEISDKFAQLLEQHHAQILILPIHHANPHQWSVVRYDRITGEILHTDSFRVDPDVFYGPHGVAGRHDSYAEEVAHTVYDHDGFTRPPTCGDLTLDQAGEQSDEDDCVLYALGRAAQIQHERNGVQENNRPFTWAPLKADLVLRYPHLQNVQAPLVGPATASHPASSGTPSGSINVVGSNMDMAQWTSDQFERYRVGLVNQVKPFLRSYGPIGASHGTIHEITGHPSAPQVFHDLLEAAEYNMRENAPVRRRSPEVYGSKGVRLLILENGKGGCAIDSKTDQHGRLFSTFNTDRELVKRGDPQYSLLFDAVRFRPVDEGNTRRERSRGRQQALGVAEAFFLAQDKNKPENYAIVAQSLDGKSLLNPVSVEKTEFQNALPDLIELAKRSENRVNGKDIVDCASGHPRFQQISESEMETSRISRDVVEVPKPITANRLGAFSTPRLYKFYHNCDFIPVAKTSFYCDDFPWDDSRWRNDFRGPQYQEYNGGEPDYVFWVLDREKKHPSREAYGDKTPAQILETLNYVSSYEEGVQAQDEALNVIRQRDIAEQSVSVQPSLASRRESVGVQTDPVAPNQSSCGVQTDPVAPNQSSYGVQTDPVAPNQSSYGVQTDPATLPVTDSQPFQTHSLTTVSRDDRRGTVPPIPPTTNIPVSPISQEDTRTSALENAQLQTHSLTTVSRDDRRGTVPPIPPTTNIPVSPISQEDTRTSALENAQPARSRWVTRVRRCASKLLKRLLFCKTERAPQSPSTAAREIFTLPSPPVSQTDYGLPGIAGVVEEGWGILSGGGGQGENVLGEPSVMEVEQNHSASPLATLIRSHT